MCNVLPSITAANMFVAYKKAGLGYARRPGGPVLTITVFLQNIKLQFFPQFQSGHNNCNTCYDYDHCGRGFSLRPGQSILGFVTGWI
jgi:hypothetical protein